MWSPTITTDCEPMNEWVSERFLRVKHHFGRRRAFPIRWLELSIHFYVVLRLEPCPRRSNGVLQNDLSDISRAQRAAAISRLAKDKLRLAWEKELQKNIL